MSTDSILHIVEIVAIGAPLWWNIARRWMLDKEYPPHLHEYNRDGSPTIRYPRGYEPGKIQVINGGK